MKTKKIPAAALAFAALLSSLSPAYASRSAVSETASRTVPAGVVATQAVLFARDGESGVAAAVCVAPLSGAPWLAPRFARVPDADFRSSAAANLPECDSSERAALARLSGSAELGGTRLAGAPVVFAVACAWMAGGGLVAGAGIRNGIRIQGADGFLWNILSASGTVIWAGLGLGSAFTPMMIGCIVPGMAVGYFGAGYLFESPKPTPVAAD